MSTLPGQASKGEKTKPKFQYLDINSLYRVSRGENLEKQQQKSSSVYIKHGMQSLGKVPNARRAPANLPSLKAEHSGTDAAVPLVPPGAPGWGKQDPATPVSSTTTPTTPTSNQTSTTSAPSQQQLSAHQAAIALPVTNAIPPHTHKQLPNSASTAPSDKLWSSVTSGHPDGVGGAGSHPPHYRSPQFQHEFPSLSSGDGGPTRTGPDAGGVVSGQPPPHLQQQTSLSLRPQTEGSWSQGGAGPAVERGPPQLAAHIGTQQQVFPPQIRGVMPSFMYKGSTFQQPQGIGIQNHQTQPPPASVNGRNTRPMDNRPPRLTDNIEEVVPRPIIKEEELTRMDEISRDVGWAESDEVDYNQKLAFSDDELEKPVKKENAKRQQPVRDQKEDKDGHSAENQQRQWSSRSSTSRGRSSEEEDIWIQRSNQTAREVEIAVQRAKQRKEEEEKRFQEERKQGAAKKLMELEEKIQKRDRDNQEGVGTINPSSVPPKPINHVDIPLPDFQKEKERDKEHQRDRDSRSRTPNESTDDKNQTSNQGSSFRHLTQIEGKNLPPRKHLKTSEREQKDRDPNGPNFSRQFISDLPPRFKQQQQRSNNNINMHNQHYHQFDQRWNQNSSKSQPTLSINPPSHNRNVRQSPEIGKEKEEDERKDYKRQSSDDSHRSSHHSQQEISQRQSEPRYSDETHDNRHQAYESQYTRKDHDEDKWHREKERSQEKIPHAENVSSRASSDDWNDKRDKIRDEKSLEKYDRDRDRPQRPDSRDSRSTRHSRESEPRDYMGSWSETPYESSYEEKRREPHREERRVVPGPITKERIEAEDMRNEKRNLTQLKRGQPVEIKSDIKKEEKEEVKKEDTFISAWADAVPQVIEEADSTKLSEEKKAGETQKIEQKAAEPAKKTERIDDYGPNRNRPYSQKKGWNNEYLPPRSQAWQKRSSSRGRGHKPNKTAIGGTDSDGSMEDHGLNEQKGESQKSPKPTKKLEKDEKNREMRQEKGFSDQKKHEKLDRRDAYVPRGEPSRHGRGGGNFRGGRGGLSKRIDGYGPPPSKSPFGGHHEDRDKKHSNDDIVSDSQPISTEDKTKQNQQALSAGIIGKRTDSFGTLDDKNKVRGKQDLRKGKPRSKDELCDTNSEHSDEKNKDNRRLQAKQQGSRSNRGGRNMPPPRMGGDKRSYDSSRIDCKSRQNSNSSLKKDDKLSDQNTLVSAIADITLKDKEEPDQVGDKDEKTSINGDSEGFQEVKSKKTGKERQKSAEDKAKIASKPELGKECPKSDRERDRERKNKTPQQLTQQQIQNIPALMATPINPPPVLPQSHQPPHQLNKNNQFERPRSAKLAPRFAKMLKQQQQQQHHGMMGDLNEMPKSTQNIGVYNMKEMSSVSQQSATTCAWDKPLGSQLRNVEQDNNMLGVSIDNVKGLDRTQPPSQGTSPNNEKMMSKPSQPQEKPLLDGSTPPVNTIIFENTNYKSTPGSRNNRNEKLRSKLEDGSIDSSVMSGFNKPIMNELLQNRSESKSDPIQLPLFKEDNADMKLDFLNPDLQFSEDKSAKNLCIISKSLHAITSGNNTVDSLDIKIASVKKVWEKPEQENEDSQISFGAPPLDTNVFNQGKDTPDDSHEGYSPSPNQTASTTTNVCKVKPTQQVSGSGQTVLSSSHQPHSGIVAASLMGNPLSPPPMPPVLGASVGIGPQQYTANQHLGYQTGLSGTSQYGISAIPSPPTVPLVYNSTQQLQAAAAAQTAGLYGAFQIDQSGVLGGQGRSQFSQYPNYHGLGQTGNSPYSTQSVYLQTAPPHPPPTAQAPPELYTNMNNYRLGAATAQFGQNQQLNNPTTVLISSTSNSLMSASVKPSSQQISAIGTKAGGVGQAYQQQSQQGQQVYIPYDQAIQANYLPPSAGVIQRGPPAPVQNNVVPALQASSSFYSGSTGGQTGFFQQPGSSTMPSTPLQQHQAGYGLQGNVFGTHSQSHTNTGLQNYNSHFLTTPIQVAAAAALNAQQFRSSLPAAYMKGVNSQQITGEQTSSRAQQLKSPSTQEVLSSVFNSGPQIPSPKSRQNMKHPPPQSSPTAQHKYNLYQGVGGQHNQNIQRYPAPIQRPVNFQQMQQNSSVNQKHRNSSSNKAPSRQYYGGQNNALTVQSDKTEDTKISDSVTLNSGSSANNNKTATIGTSSATTVNSATEKVKDNIKEETAALKD